MLYFFYGDNQKDLKDHIFDLKKRAPVVEEIDAAMAAWEDFFARAKTATFLFSEKKKAARLIVLSSFTKSSAQFQNDFFAHAADLARLPDVIVLFEEGEVEDKALLRAMQKSATVKHFEEQKKVTARDPLVSFLFGCASAWVRGDSAGALRSAHAFFEHGGSAEQLLFMLAAYAKKTKNPHDALCALRDQCIASRLQKADLRSLMFAFLSR